jgi:hypothetical protein
MPLIMRYITLDSSRALNIRRGSIATNLLSLYPFYHFNRVTITSR